MSAQLVRPQGASAEVGYGKLLRFYAPLGLATGLSSATHFLVSAALARTSEPTVAFATYGVAQAFAMVADAPAQAMRQTVLALGRGPAAFERTLWIMGGAAAAIVLTALVAIKSGWVGYLLQEVLKFPEHLVPQTLVALQVFIWMPVATWLRVSYEAGLVLCRRPLLVTASTPVRFAVVWILAYLFITYRWGSGGQIGAYLVVLGILSQGVFSVVAFRWIQAKTRWPSPGEPAPPGSTVLVFWLPLAIAPHLLYIVRPLIQMGLARTPDPELGLAIYSLAANLSVVFILPLLVLHQITVVFGPRTVGFVLFVGCLASAGIGAMAATGLGAFVLTEVVGVEPGLVPAVQTVLLAVALHPILIAAAEYVMASHLLARRSRPIGLARGINLVMTVSTLFILLAHAGDGVLAAAFAYLSQAIGYAGEAAVLTLAAVLYRSRAAH